MQLCSAQAVIVFQVFAWCSNMPDSQPNESKRMSKHCEKFVDVPKQFGQSTLTASTCCCWKFRFLHLLCTHTHAHTHFLCTQIKLWPMFSSDIWSKCFLVLTGWFRTNLLLHHSSSLWFSVSEIFTDFGWLWEPAQVDFFPWMSQSRIHVIIYTCATNVYMQEKNFCPLDDLIFAWCMNLLSWQFPPKSVVQKIWIKNWDYTKIYMPSWKCSLQLPHVTHAAITPC